MPIRILSKQGIHRDIGAKNLCRRVLERVGSTDWKLIGRLNARQQVGGFLGGRENQSTIISIRELYLVSRINLLYHLLKPRSLRAQINIRGLREERLGLRRHREMLLRLGSRPRNSCRRRSDCLLGLSGGLSSGRSLSRLRRRESHGDFRRSFLNCLKGLGIVDSWI